MSFYCSVAHRKSAIWQEEIVMDYKNNERLLTELQSRCYSLVSESEALKREWEQGPGRGGLFLCRLQPLTQRKCLLLCHAASHSGSSWRMTADIIVPPAHSRNGTGRDYLTIRSPDWLQHYRRKWVGVCGLVAIAARQSVYLDKPAPKVRYKWTPHL